MASLQSLLMPIHGVEYELSGIFQRGNRKHIQLPEDFDIKDPEVLLEECTVSHLQLVTYSHSYFQFEIDDLIVRLSIV